MNTIDIMEPPKVPINRGKCLFCGTFKDYVSIVSDSEGRRFESFQARQKTSENSLFSEVLSLAKIYRDGRYTTFTTFLLGESQSFNADCKE